jgi:FixJ family two-component response regulator
MWELHHEIARRILLGQKNTVIAESLHCNPQTVSLVRNSPIVKDKIAIMEGAADANAVDVATRIRELAPEALDVLEEVMRAKETASMALRAKVAESVLDRAGHSAVRTIKSEGIHAHLSLDDLNTIKQRAIEKAREAGIVVNMTE